MHLEAHCRLDQLTLSLLCFFCCHEQVKVLRKTNGRIIMGVTGAIFEALKVSKRLSPSPCLSLPISSYPISHPYIPLPHKLQTANGGYLARANLLEAAQKLCLTKEHALYNAVFYAMDGARLAGWAIYRRVSGLQGGPLTEATLG